MRAYPDDEPDMELLDRVCRRLPQHEAEAIGALPREDFLTWIETYFALRRSGVVLDDALRVEFMAQLFEEVGIELEVAEVSTLLPIDARSNYYQSPFAFTAASAAAAAR